MPTNIVSIASLTRVCLYSGAPGTSSATLYTAPAGTTVKITSIVVVNTTGSAATLTLNLVRVSIDLNPANSNRLYSAFSFAANSQSVLRPDAYIQGNDYIAALQGTASALNVWLFGEIYS